MAELFISSSPVAVSKHRKPSTFISDHHREQPLAEADQRCKAPEIEQRACTVTLHDKYRTVSSFIFSTGISDVLLHDSYFSTSRWLEDMFQQAAVIL